THGGASFAFIVFLEENNFTTKGAPLFQNTSYTRNHHNSN
ncbi:MAG: hypothetical protein ACI9UO_000423, partial [Nitrospinales bacterium]